VWWVTWLRQLRTEVVAPVDSDDADDSLVAFEAQSDLAIRLWRAVQDGVGDHLGDQEKKGVHSFRRQFESDGFTDKSTRPSGRFLVNREPPFSANRIAHTCNPSDHGTPKTNVRLGGALHATRSCLLIVDTDTPMPLDPNQVEDPANGGRRLAEDNAALD